MPGVKILFYREKDVIPALEWIDRQQKKVQLKLLAHLELLAQEGHALRRPYADYLRDGIYELRVRLGSVNYRLLYFFHGRTVVVIAHGLTKEREVPVREIDLAVERKYDLSRTRKNTRRNRDEAAHPSAPIYGWIGRSAPPLRYERGR